MIQLSIVLMLLASCGTTPIQSYGNPGKYTGFGKALSYQSQPYWLGREGTDHVGSSAKLVLINPDTNTIEELNTDPAYDYRGGAVGIVDGKITQLSARWVGGFTQDFTEITVTPGNPKIQDKPFKLNLGPRANCYGVIERDRAICYGHSNDVDFKAVMLEKQGSKWESIGTLPSHGPIGYGETSFTFTSSRDIIAVGRTSLDGLGVLASSDGGKSWTSKVIYESGKFAAPWVFKDGGRVFVVVTDREERALSLYEVNEGGLIFVRHIYYSRAEYMRDFGYGSVLDGLLYFNDSDGDEKPMMVRIPLNGGI